MSAQLLKEIMIEYDQFKQSKLHNAIVNVNGCLFDEAFAIGKYHCNMVSFWGLLTAKKKFSISYEDFYRKLLLTKLYPDKNYCTVNGYTYATKLQIAKLFKIDIKITEFKSKDLIDLKVDDVFQIAINDKHHFMSVGVESDNILHLYDTHTDYRGPYGGELTKALKRHDDKIDWFKKID